jgi:hypothetical protein
MTKRSPNEVWAALEDDALEAEMDAVLAMSPEERRRELREAGFDLEKVHAQADALGAPPARPEREARVRPRRLRLAVVIPLAAALAAGVALAVKSALPPAPVAEGRPDDSPSELRAAALRQEARQACEARSWPTCLDKLNEARALDPTGDQAPEVQSWRSAARAAGDPRGR